MIWQPKPGQRVIANYANKKMPYQGKTGVVEVCTTKRGGIKNALVRLDSGLLVVIPRGHLNYA